MRGCVHILTCIVISLGRDPESDSDLDPDADLDPLTAARSSSSSSPSPAPSSWSIVMRRGRDPDDPGDPDAPSSWSSVIRRGRPPSSPLLDPDPDLVPDLLDPDMDPDPDLVGLSWRGALSESLATASLSMVRHRGRLLPLLLAEPARTT